MLDKNTLSGNINDTLRQLALFPSLEVVSVCHSEYRGVADVSLLAAYPKSRITGHQCGIPCAVREAWLMPDTWLCIAQCIDVVVWAATAEHGDGSLWQVLPLDLVLCVYLCDLYVFVTVGQAGFRCPPAVLKPNDAEFRCPDGSETNQTSQA